MKRGWPPAHTWVASRSSLQRSSAVVAATQGSTMEQTGIDVHKKATPCCNLPLIEHRVRTRPERLAEVLGGRSRGIFCRGLLLAIPGVGAHGECTGKRHGPASSM